MFFLHIEYNDLLIIFFLIFKICVWMCIRMCVRVCKYGHVSGRDVNRVQKRVSNPLELKLQEVLSCLM